MTIPFDDLRSERERLRTDIDGLRPVLTALEAWYQSWLRAGAPPPDDLPEERELFLAIQHWKETQ